MTLNQIIENLKGAVGSQINHFYFGNPADFLQMNTEHNEACALLTVNTAEFVTSNETLSSLTRVDFTIYFGDWTGLTVSNSQEIWSDMLQVSHDFIAKIKDISVYDWDVDSISLESFMEDKEDSLTGWQVNFSITYDSEYDRCAIP